MGDHTHDDVTILVNGIPLVAQQGEALLMVLLRNRLGWRTAGEEGAPRGAFCNMGVCQECIVTVEGKGAVRACLTRVEGGDTVELP